MSELSKRVLSALIFGSVVIGAFLLHPLAFAGVLTIILIIAVKEWTNLANIFNADTPFLLILLVSVTIYASFLCAFFNILSTNIIIISFLMILSIFAVIEICRNKKNIIQNLVFLFFGSMYISVPLGLFFLLLNENLPFAKKYNYLPLFIFFVIWTYDTFAYFTGSLFGKHKLIPKISPNKTWEGLIGGVVFTLILVFFFTPEYIGFSVLGSVIASSVIIISATFGDMFESALKRKAGIKNSGKFLPGHGGVLDRFDSVFFAMPAFVLYLSLDIRG